MEQKLLFFEKKSIELFNRKIAQTLLIHANLLNADYLEQIAKMYIKHDYSFISQKEVLFDEAYSEPIKVYSKRGLSWIFRWALSIGKGKDFLKDDPDTSNEIKDLAKR